MPKSDSPILQNRVLRKKKKHQNLNASRSSDAQEETPVSRKRKWSGVEEPLITISPIVKPSHKGKERETTNSEVTKQSKKRKRSKGKARGGHVGTSTGPPPAVLASTDSFTLSSEGVEHDSKFVDKDAEIQRLQKELALKNELLNKHENVLSSLQNALQCQICLEMLWKPYLVTPCGHVLCEGCLKGWFTTNCDSEEPIVPHLRKKTCPYCRTEVKTRPVSVYLIKSAVSTIIPSLDPSSYTHPEEDASQRDQFGTLEVKDVWEGIFPPLAPSSERERAEHPDVMYDDEDGGVPRCRDCMHEIFDGMCTGCGRLYLGVDQLPSDDEGEELFFNSFFDVATDIDEYEPSFIDDGDQEDTHPVMRNYTDDSEADEEFHDAPTLAVREESGHELDNNQTHSRRHRYRVEVTSEDEDDDDDPPYVPNRRRQPACSVSSDTDGSDDISVQIPGSLRGRRRTRVNVTVGSGEDSEDQRDHLSDSEHCNSWRFRGASVSGRGSYQRDRRNLGSLAICVNHSPLSLIVASGPLEIVKAVILTNGI
ncbi:uncharacterized protein EI90DRAFT_1107972 [Cantharellus anzutake]|uniref:uncharacterized protein n=1 Tax=Cantharellus anzutake TaxID=1750568 RepID=UPI0019041583|nr:uncharacterized protein EI90DRAFT_1107972 [Cantharellus anzutake]KAF8330879.1 hypothetical protein EI90DRAFT_1107972 [Cantharellus anzutake]